MPGLQGESSRGSQWHPDPSPRATAVLTLDSLPWPTSRTHPTTGLQPLPTPDYLVWFMLPFFFFALKPKGDLKNAGQNVPLLIFGGYKNRAIPSPTHFRAGAESLGNWDWSWGMAVPLNFRPFQRLPFSPSLALPGPQPRPQGQVSASSRPRTTHQSPPGRPHSSAVLTERRCATLPSSADTPAPLEGKRPWHGWTGGSGDNVGPIPARRRARAEGRQCHTACCRADL